MIELHPDDIAAGQVVHAQTPFPCKQWTRKAGTKKNWLSPRPRYTDIVCALNDLLPPENQHDWPMIEMTVKRANPPYIQLTHMDLDPVHLVVDAREVPLFIQGG